MALDLGWKCQRCGITTFGGMNCTAASDMGDFLCVGGGGMGQNLVSDNPVCLEPGDSWVSVPLMTKADGSQSLYQKGENEGQTDN